MCLFFIHVLLQFYVPSYVKKKKMDNFMCLLEFECAKRLKAHSQAIPEGGTDILKKFWVVYWTLLVLKPGYYSRIIHYNDVIMGATASQITSLTIVYSIVIQTQIKENIKALCHWPLCGEFTGDRWIPCTNGQIRGKCFHLMTSSWAFSLGPLHHQDISSNGVDCELNQ